MPGSVSIRAALVALALHQLPCWAQTDGGAPQASSAWLGEQYGYVANQESLRSLLYDFGTTLGVPVIVSTRINVVADDKIPVMSAEDFLAEVHTRFGVVWIFDGTTLYLYDRAEAVEETLDFPFILRDDFKVALDAAGIHGVPLNLLFVPGEDSLQISGPPRFVEWGKEAAAALIARMPEEPIVQTPGDVLSPIPAPDYVIRIFDVRYGYVD